MTLTGQNRITGRATCLSITNDTWTGLRCDTCKKKSLGHGTTEACGGTKIMYVSGFQVDYFLYLVHKSFEVT
jgi:hypothetical protein